MKMKVIIVIIVSLYIKLLENSRIDIKLQIKITVTAKL
jgi:hypothetical protein